jgi:primosomal replication protein N''
MTPDVASRVLQPKLGIFDTVIFDEASQMPVEYALPSLFRSKIVVVSGDEKQMPPTSFFASKVENDEAAIFDGDEPEDAASEEERDVFTETWNRREIKDCPDLLQLARSVLRSRTLQVHYRSKYRELISFSNASFYGIGHPSTHFCWDMSRDSRVEPFVWTTT